MGPLQKDSKEPPPAEDEGEYGPQIDMKVPTTFQGWMALIGKTLAPGWSTEPRSIATMGASDMAACARMRFTIETDGSARMNFPCVGSGGAITLQARTDSAAHRGHQQRCR
jgi:hypothetical protein